MEAAAKARSGADVIWDRINWYLEELIRLGFHNHKNLIEKYELRAKFNQEFGWGIAHKNTFQLIANWVSGEKCLEINAGTGFWAAILRDMGVDIIATDAATYTKTYFDVEQIDAVKAIKKYPTNVLLTVWPPYCDDCSDLALKTFTGNKLIYVGESDGGCTGSDEFHILIRRDWKLNIQVPLAFFDGIYDLVFLYEKKAIH